MGALFVWGEYRLHRLIGRIAAAASALVLALNCFALSASAEKEKKSKKSGTDSSAAETVVDEDEDEEEDSGDSSGSKKKKSKDESKSADDTDTKSDEETDGDSEEEETEEETEQHKENFHRSGAWGYTMLPDNTAAISKYYGDSIRPKIPEEIDGFPVTAVSGGWYIDEAGTVLIYGNIHSLTYDDTGMISGSSVYSPFSGNNTIVEITVPDSVKYIGAIAFKGCKKLKKVTLGTSVQVIGNNCFEDCKQLEAVTIPASVKYIDQKAFGGCTALTEINVPAAHLEASVFEGCTSLANAVLGSTENVPQLMFSGCTALTNIAMPDGVTSIDDGAFENCTSLTVVTIPDSVKEIRNNAFAGCTSLQSVTMSQSLESMGNQAFADCPLTTLTLPDSLTRIGKAAFGMTADGAPIEGFVLTCPEYSPVQSYAQNNSLSFETTEGVRSPVTTTQRAASDEETGEQVDPFNSELMYKLLLIILGITAFSVIAAIILIIKNHRLGDTPESEDYFPGDDFDEEQDLDDNEYDRWADPDGNGADNNNSGYSQPLQFGDYNRQKDDYRPMDDIMFAPPDDK